MKKPRKDGTLQGVFCRNSNAKIEKQTSKSNQKNSSEIDKHRSKARWLIQPAIAEKVKEAIHFGDGKEYELIAYTIMPNHVHVVFTPIEENVGRDLSRQQSKVDMNVDL